MGVDNESIDGEKKHGIIALLDILGTKNQSLKDIENFKKKILTLYDRLDEIKQSFDELQYGTNITLRSQIHELETLVMASESYLGNKEEDIQRLKNFKIEIEIVTFSDTILIAFYPNDNEISKDDLLLQYSASILILLFRDMFAEEKVLLRGVISIGDFYLIRKKMRIIFLGAPMFEAAKLFENSNWGGIVTTPSATLTLDQLNSFQDSHLIGSHSDKENSDKVSIISTIRSMAPTNLKHLLVKYDIPLKSVIERDGYAIAWPSINDDRVGKIEKNLEELLDYAVFQKQLIGYDLFIKYKNTKIFYDYFKDKGKFSYEDIIRK